MNSLLRLDAQVLSTDMPAPPYFMQTGPSCLSIPSILLAFHIAVSLAPTYDIGGLTRSMCRAILPSLKWCLRCFIPIFGSCSIMALPWVMWFGTGKRSTRIQIGEVYEGLCPSVGI